MLDANYTDIIIDNVIIIIIITNINIIIIFQVYLLLLLLFLILLLHRNYQEHVAELITDWTIAEEALYHANLLSEDVEQDITDAAKAAAAAAKEAKKGARSRSKSPKGGRKGSGVCLQISFLLFAPTIYFLLPV